MAQKNFDPVLPPLPDDFEDELEEESVKIVRLVKNKEPLVRCREQRSLQEKWIKAEEIIRLRPLLLSVNDLILSLCLQGATIRRDEATGVVVVARIMRGGAADRSGKLCFLSFCLCFLQASSHHWTTSTCSSQHGLEHRHKAVKLI